MEKTTEPPRIVAGSVCIEVRGDQVLITPNKKHPGSAVWVPLKSLENWARRIYRAEVLR